MIGQLFLFALFYMIIILLMDTFILLCIFLIGGLEEKKKVFLYGYSKIFSAVISK